MSKLCRLYLFFLIFISSLHVVEGQKNTKSTEHSKYEKIQREIYSAKDKNQAFLLSKKYIEEARTDENNQELLSAYSNAADAANDSVSSKYGDSILYLAIKLKDQAAIGTAYNTIANTSFIISDYKKSAEFSVISYDYFISQNKEDLARRCLFTIGKLKSLIGEDESARMLFKDQYLYFKENQGNSDNKLWYSFYLTSLIITNAKLSKHKDNELLIEESYMFYQTNKSLNSSEFQVFIADAINDFYMRKFSSSIFKMNTALDLMKKNNYQIPEEFYFLLARCYWKSGQFNKAFPIFKKIRDNYSKKRRAPLSFRPAFDFFTEYYKKHGTTEQQLAAMNDLLEFDSYERDIRKNVQLKLKEFDKKYNLEKDYSVQDERNYNNLLSYAIILLSSIAVVFFVLKKVKSQKKDFGKDFTKILIDNDDVLSPDNTQAKNSDSYTEEKFDYSHYRPINRFTVDQIISAMDAFESCLGFLEKDLRLTSLAQKFNTNEKYLSKVIRVKTGKTFNAYLTDLRFTYFDRMLQNDPLFRHQKIKEISARLGFGSPEFFTTAFKERYGKSPKDFFK